MTTLRLLGFQATIAREAVPEEKPASSHAAPSNERHVNLFFSRRRKAGFAQAQNGRGGQWRQQADRSAEGAAADALAPRNRVPDGQAAGGRGERLFVGRPPRHLGHGAERLAVATDRHRNTAVHSMDCGLAVPFNRHFFIARANSITRKFQVVKKL